MESGGGSLSIDFKDRIEEVFSSVKETGGGDIDDLTPFTGRRSLARTPPRRTLSVSDIGAEAVTIISDLPENDSGEFKIFSNKKRKAVSPVKQGTGEISMGLLTLRRTIGELQKHIDSNRNTNKEVKLLAQRLTGIAKRCIQENMEDRARISHLERKCKQSMGQIPTKVSCDKGVQVEGKPEMDFSLYLDIKLEAAKAYADVAKVCTRKWPEDSYTCAMAKSGNLLNGPEETQILMVDEDDINTMAKGIAKLAKDRYPELVETSGTPEEQETPESVSFASTRRCSDGTIKKSERTIYKMTLGKVNDTDSAAEAFYNKMKAMRRHLLDDNNKGASVSLPSKLDVTRARNILEAVFRRGGAKVALYAPNRKEDRNAMAPKQPMTRNSEGGGLYGYPVTARPMQTC